MAKRKVHTAQNKRGIIRLANGMRVTVKPSAASLHQDTLRQVIEVGLAIPNGR